MKPECNVWILYKTHQSYPEWIRELCHFHRLPCVGEHVTLITQTGFQGTFRVAIVRHVAQMEDPKRRTDIGADAEVWVTDVEITDSTESIFSSTLFVSGPTTSPACFRWMASAIAIASFAMVLLSSDTCCNDDSSILITRHDAHDTAVALVGSIIVALEFRIADNHAYLKSPVGG